MHLFCFYSCNDVLLNNDGLLNKLKHETQMCMHVMYREGGRVGEREIETETETERDVNSKICHSVFLCRGCVKPGGSRGGRHQ